MTNEERLLLIEEKLNKVLAYYEQENFSDKMVLRRNLILKDKDGKVVLNSQEGGVTIGSASGKVGLYGKTPIVKASTIAAPSAAGGTYSQSQVDSIVTAVNAIRVVLQNIGITN